MAVTNSASSWLDRLLSLTPHQVVCVLVLTVAVVVLVKYALLPLLKHFSLGNLLRAIKMLLKEILGHHGRLGVLNIVSFVVLAILSFVVFQSESGGGIKSLIPQNGADPQKSPPYIFCLCLILTVGVLSFSLYLLYKIEQRNVALNSTERSTNE